MRTFLVLSCPDTEIYWLPVHKAVGYQRRAHHPFHSEKEKREISLQLGSMKMLLWKTARDILGCKWERCCCPRRSQPHILTTPRSSHRTWATLNSHRHKPTLLTFTQKIHKTISHNASKSSKGACSQSGYTPGIRAKVVESHLASEESWVVGSRESEPWNQRGHRSPQDNSSYNPTWEGSEPPQPEKCWPRSLKCFHQEKNRAMKRSKK